LLATAPRIVFDVCMNEIVNRRRFLKQTSATAAGLAALGGLNLLRAGESPNQKLVVAVMGCNSRGLVHIESWLQVPNVEVAYICDVDSRALAKGIEAVAKKQRRKPKGEKDIRRVLEDKDVDAISIATPNHWHAPATILACAAGKHVYVEKPGSHNPHEAQLIVAAARQHKRVVQMGNQRRSWPWLIEAMQRLHAGEIGRVLFARTWYNAKRGSIGHGKVVPVPAWLDYELWQGPATERPFVDNLVHYKWHWRWHWGNGEMGNNAVHFLDLARWGLQVDQPRRVTCGGRRYYFDDDQETPDTCVLTVDFGDKGLSWEGMSCHPRGAEGAKPGGGVIFYGDTGVMIFASDKCRFCDLEDKVLASFSGPTDVVSHFTNFTDAIRDGKKLNSDIEEGQQATMLCHLGNIAWRTGHTVNVDPQTHTIVGDEAAQALWQREYRPGWEPKV
jgi:predicted dehydrogenase